MLVGCALSRPGHLIEPDVVGLVTARHRPSLDQPLTVELGDRTLQVDKDSAVELTGPGISADRLLLYGEDDGRIWYVTAARSEASQSPDCYKVYAAAAYDAPDAVILVFVEWQEVGVRLPKRADFSVPPGVISSDDGRYLGSESGAGTFCVDPHGFVFV